MQNKMSNRSLFIIKFLFLSISYLFFSSVLAESGVTQKNIDANSITTNNVSSSPNLSPADALLLKQAQEETARDKAVKLQQQAQETSPQGLVTAPSTLQSAPISSNLEQSSAVNQQQSQLAPPVVIPSPNLRITPPLQPQLDLSKEDAKIQVMDERLITLEASIVSLQKQIGSLTEYVNGLTSEINKSQQELQKVKIQNQIKTVAKEKPKNLVQYFFVELWPKPLIKVVFFVFCFSVILVLWLIFRHSKKNISKPMQEQQTASSEYDFMEGEQGINARLNLARAYIAMDKKQEARDLLEEILVKGDEAQRKDAEDLIRKLL